MRSIFSRTLTLNLSPRHRYRPLQDLQDADVDIGAPRGPRARRLAICVCVSFVILMVFLFSLTWGSIPKIPFLESCDSGKKGYQCRPEISHHWGQYAPFFQVPSEISLDVPSSCNITFAQVLSRHGARDPTLGRTIFYAALLKRLQQDVTRFSDECSFIKDFEYTLGADQLTAFGQEQMVLSGKAFYWRYRTLANDATPFVRASGQNRVVASAKNFTNGMQRAAIDDKAESADSYPLAILTIPETKGSNNTLSDGLCDAFESGPFSSIGHDAKQQWASGFVPPILKRLDTNMPGANLALLDVIALMDMCPLHTVSLKAGKISPFCDLFSEEEWKQYDYYQSLDKYYGHGPGNPLGPTQGVGFVNELIARLTGSVVEDGTSVNHTLDDNPKTFPVGKDHNLFADFSHDNDMISIFSAFGFLDKIPPLSNSSMSNATRTGGYSAAWTVPFAARAYFEKMKCSNEEEEHVRVIINDRVLPLEQCGGDTAGRCSLKNFVDSLSFAARGGRWGDC